MVDKKIVKSSGEHWVCSVLSRLEWSVALTRDGVERTDILAVNQNSDHRSIQVKTSSPARHQRFHLGEKGCLTSRSENEWYVLVALEDCEWASPRSFVVPRNHVAAGTWIEHREWLTNPTQPKGKRNTPISGARISWTVFARYENRWDLLDLPTSEVPVLLPPRFRTLIKTDRVGLREDHPWNHSMPAWDMSEVHPSWSDWLSTEG